MSNYHRSALADNPPINPLSITFADEPTPSRATSASTRPGFTMIRCRACGSAWRVEAGTDLWAFRYQHADTCLDLLDRIALHLARIGVASFIRRRVDIIGSAIIAEPVIHRRRKGRELTACDHRCQQAKGAECDCSCGGAMHGVAHAR